MNPSQITLQDGIYVLDTPELGEDCTFEEVLQSFFRAQAEQDFVDTLNYSVAKGDMTEEEAAIVAVDYNASGPDVAVRTVFRLHPELFNEESAAELSKPVATQGQTNDVAELSD
ncbi:MAG TPA: hypothetical protein VJ279_01270 [Hanamia sp.]|jgi:hypothetical protein|nr:hypothetical protein [Hanamia sp.]